MRSFFVLVAVVNYSVDDDDMEGKHTGGVGRWSRQPSVGGYRPTRGVTEFMADRSAFSLVREMEEVQVGMLIV